MNVGELLVKIGANTRDLKRGVAEAKREVASLPDEHTVKLKVDNKDLRKANGGGGGKGGKGGFLAADLTELPFTVEALIMALPILSTSIVTATGALGGLASMFGTATIGAIGFGSVTVGVLGDVFDAQKDIEKANSDLAKATTQEEQKTAIENLHQAYMGLNGGQLAALASLQKFKDFWNSFKSSFQAPVVVGFSKALEGLQYFLNSIGPAIKATGAAVVGIFTKMNEAMKGADFQKAFSWLGTSAGGAISTFGDIAIKVFQGVLNLMVAFQPLSDAMQGGLRGMAQSFLQWTQSLASSESFKQFVNYVIATAPQVLMFFKTLIMTVVDLITVLSPLGNVLLGVINITLSFVNVLFNLMFGIGNLKNRVETLKNSFLDLGNAIAVMLGYKTVSTTSQQTDEVSNLNQAYQDMVGSIGDVGGGLKDAGKDAQKFLASFDEMYQIPDKLDSAMGSLPKPPTPPIGGGIGGGGTSGGGVSGWGDPSGNGLFDKLAENFNKIPKTITTPVFEPTLEETETKSKTALDGIITKIGQVSPAFSIMLTTMNGSLKTNTPSIIQNIGLITSSMAFPTLTTSLAFSTMLADMLSNSKTYIPSIKTWLQDITDKLINMRTEMNPTSTAFDVMLAAFMTSVNTNVPLVVTALMLITDWIKNIGTESPKTQTAFHEMLDFMQSKANAYQPYISTQLSFIKEALEDVKQSSSETRINWRTVFEDMAKVTHSNSLSIISDIGKIISKQKELNETMGQTITTPTRERTPAVEEPNLQWAPPTTTYNPPDVTPTVEPTIPEDQNPTQVEQNGKVDSWFRKFIDAIINAPKVNTGGINITPSIGGGVDFKKFLENLPGHANGAVIGNETIARIGEKNKREAIIPLESGAMNPFADAVADRLGGSGGGVNIEIKGNIYGGPSGIKELARLVNQALRNEAGRGATT